MIADLARDAELSRETTSNVVALLEALYLVTQDTFLELVAVAVVLR